MCTMSHIFCSLIPWCVLSNKIREGQGQNGENEMLSKWDGIHRVFSTHTQVHRNASPKNLGCRGTELLTLLKMANFLCIFLTLTKIFFAFFSLWLKTLTHYISSLCLLQAMINSLIWCPGTILLWEIVRIRDLFVANHMSEICVQGQFLMKPSCWFFPRHC